MRWPKFKKFWTKTEEELPVDESEKQEEQSKDEIDLGDIHFGEELDPEAKAKTFAKKKIFCAAGVVAAVTLTAIASNHLFSTQPKEDKPLGTQSIANAATPADQLPGKYSDIDKTKKPTANEKPEPAKQQTGPDNRTTAPARTNTPAAAQTPSRAPAMPAAAVAPVVMPAANHTEQTAAREKQKEVEARNNSEIAFKLAAAISKEQAANAIQPLANAPVNTSGNVMQTSVQTAAPHYGVETYEDSGTGSYILNAGAVIQASLLTGITSDVANSDVVAQVRQNIYDSLTGMHLLIPQGSRLIGRAGSAGGLGNHRIGVKFYRIILPNGSSLTLPDQQAIDGTGYPGLADKYMEHSGRLYRTAFLSALLAAAAQSATGNTSGSDDRSPGQEAVSGAAAAILSTGNKLVERDAKISPTIEIEPGFQFSVFVNQDLLVGEYDVY